MSGAHIAIQRRRANRKRQRREEEFLTSYSPEALAAGWQFKILRSATAAFRRPETVKRALRREAIGGWELVEQIDNRRLRLRRPAQAARRDDNLPRGYQPYGSFFGPGLWLREVFFSLSVMSLLALAGLLLWLVSPLFSG